MPDHDQPDKEPSGDHLPEVRRSQLATIARILGYSCWGATLAVFFLVHHETWTPIGLVGALACAVAGVVVGVVALIGIRRSRGRLTGNGAAWSGICFCSAYLVVLSWLVFIVAPRIRQEVFRGKCAANLHNIAGASGHWLKKSGAGNEVSSWMKALADNGVIPDSRSLLCPQSGTKLKPGEFVCDYECIFDRAGFRIAEGMAPRTLPLAWDKRGNLHGRGEAPGLDAHVEFVRDEESAAAYDKIIKQVDDWIAENRPRDQ